MVLQFRRGLEAAMLNQGPPTLVRAGIQALWMPALDYYPGISAQTVADRSGNGNTLTLGSTSGVDANDPSWSQQGLVFNAAGSNYASTASTAAAPTGASGITMMAVVNCTPNSLNQVFSAIGPVTPGTRGAFSVAVNSTPDVTAFDQGNDVQSTIPIGSGWVMATSRYATAGNVVTLTKNDSTATQFSAALSGAVSIPNPTVYSVGRWVAGSLYFNGTGAAFLVYDRTLSDAELVRVYRWLHSQLAPSGVTLP